MAGIFTPLLPHAHAQNARVVAVNRRDYPGTRPYPPEERALLEKTKETGAVELALEFVMNRGREVLAFLAELVRRDGIPLADVRANAGGIVLVGWSLGTVWMNAALAALNAGSDDTLDVDLSKYLRRVIIYGTKKRSRTYSKHLLKSRYRWTDLPLRLSTSGRRLYACPHPG